MYKPMTPEEAVIELKNMSGDPESDHVRADEILLRVLLFYELDEVVDAYEKVSVNFWYA